MPTKKAEFTHDLEAHDAERAAALRELAASQPDEANGHLDPSCPDSRFVLSSPDSQGNSLLKENKSVGLRAGNIK